MLTLDRGVIAAELRQCWSAPGRFNTTILGRGPYWARQREIARSVAEHQSTLVPTGNAVGKTYLAAGLILEYLTLHPGSLVLATAPTQTQLEEVLWKEVERAYKGARVPLGGRLLQSPLKIDLGGGWQALAYSTTKVERFSGHHAADLLVVVDEASGVADPIYEAIRSLGPSRELLIGNPLAPSGTFYERCQRAAADPGGLANLIQISSLESPHIGLPRSPWGLADAGWLAAARNDYGEGSLWWTCHVLGLFPDSGIDSLIPSSWLDLAGAAIHVRSGPVRIAIDLAEGGGGDRSVVLTRDDNGILSLDSSSRWGLAETAAKAAERARQWGVEPHRVSFDAAGIGADFANRLHAAGIVGARPYRGGLAGGKGFSNLRSVAAWVMRQRLDPNRTTTTAAGGVAVRQAAFAIPREHLAAMRDELQGLRYTQDAKGRVCLEAKEDMVKRLRKSPDLADTLGQSFAFPG